MMGGEGSRSVQSQKSRGHAGSMAISADSMELSGAIAALQSGLELGPYGQAFIPGCGLEKGGSLPPRQFPKGLN